MELCQSKGLKKPEIIESGMFVKYIFYRQSDAKQDGKSKTIIYEIKIIEYLRLNKEINVSSAKKLLNLSKSRINAVLNNMKETGIIERQGDSRATKYVLKEKDE